jgi:peptidyl-prolyl cis-trans isomerase A (cyclophilin A)
MQASKLFCNHFAVAATLLLLGGCGPTVPPPPEAPSPQAPQPVATTASIAVPDPPAALPESHEPAVPQRAKRVSVLDNVASARRVSATIDTDLGLIQCLLFPDKAPITVHAFVGLATGEMEWKDPRTGDVSHEPAYDGTSFHRIIPGFMIQGGDPKGDGSGEPGFTFQDEIWVGSKHDRAGLLCMANRGKNTNGAQFFITDAAAPHLDGGYTIFGECQPLGVIHTIATAPSKGDRPLARIGIRHVEITLD